jgi:multiple sugar transport system permease protein
MIGNRSPSFRDYLVNYSLLILLSASMVFPLIWMVGTALKSDSDLITAFLPSSPTLENFEQVLGKMDFLRYYVNSIIIAGVTTIGQLFTSSLAGFAFARLRFPGRDLIFFAYLSTMMIPAAVTMVPLFAIMTGAPNQLNGLFGTTYFTDQLYFLGEFYAGRAVGIDSYFSIIAPGLFSPFGVFMMRQFFVSIPRELDEAAAIDGCSTFQIYSRIILPLAKPALGALAIFTFMGSWRVFLWPLIMTNSDAMKNLPVGLTTFMGEYLTDWPLLMAAASLMILPMVIVFILFQRVFVSGIHLGAVKG